MQNYPDPSPTPTHPHDYIWANENKTRMLVITKMYKCGCCMVQNYIGVFCHTFQKVTLFQLNEYFMDASVVRLKVTSADFAWSKICFHVRFEKQSPYYFIFLRLVILKSMTGKGFLPFLFPLGNDESWSSLNIEVLTNSLLLPAHKNIHVSFWHIIVSCVECN